MKYTPEQAGTCTTDNYGGRKWDYAQRNNVFLHNMKILTLIWRLVKIFFRYGNQEVYYHICSANGAYDVPMDAENVEVRLTNTGPHVTIW